MRHDLTIVILTLSCASLLITLLFQTLNLVRGSWKPKGTLPQSVVRNSMRFSRPNSALKRRIREHALQARRSSASPEEQLSSTIIRYPLLSLMDRTFSHRAKSKEQESYETDLLH